MKTFVNTRGAVATDALPAWAECADALADCRNGTTDERNASCRRTFVRKVLSSAFLGALLASGSAVIAAGSDADPAVGTWKLNAAKSTFAGIPAYKSQVRIYSRSGQDITLKMTTVGGDGKETKTQAIYKLNGKDYPSMGNPDFDSLSGADRY